MLSGPDLITSSLHLKLDQGPTIHAALLREARLVMGNLLVRSWCKVGNAGLCVSTFILQLLSHALTGVVFLFARLWLGERKAMKRGRCSPSFLHLDAQHRSNEVFP